MLGLCFDAMMNDGRHIDFEIILPVQYDTFREAEQGNIHARLERQERETVISLYQVEGFDHINAKWDYILLKTIRWRDRADYKCFIQKKEKSSKGCISVSTDFEACGMKFDDILCRLTKKDEFLLGSPDHWFKPASAF